MDHFSHDWWHEVSTESGSESYYPIRLGMKILTELNGKEFLLHVVSIKKQPEEISVYRRLL